MAGWMANAPIQTNRYRQRNLLSGGGKARADSKVRRLTVGSLWFDPMRVKSPMDQEGGRSSPPILVSTDPKQPRDLNLDLPNGQRRLTCQPVTNLPIPARSWLAALDFLGIVLIEIMNQD